MGDSQMMLLGVLVVVALVVVEAGAFAVALMWKTCRRLLAEKDAAWRGVSDTSRHLLV